MKACISLLLAAILGQYSSADNNLTIELNKKVTKEVSKYREELLPNLTESVFKDGLG